MTKEKALALLRYRQKVCVREAGNENWSDEFRLRWQSMANTLAGAIEIVEQIDE